MRLLLVLRSGLLIIGGFGGVLLLVLAAPRFERLAPVFGVSFSPAFASQLGLDWQATYQAVLHDLGVRQLRLGAYWNEIELQRGQFDFSALDYQMDEAAKADARVILTVGRKIQRWPECHTPAWAGSLPEDEQQQAILDMLVVVVERYRVHPALGRWQVENEPFFVFGECPKADEAFFAQEVALVRSLDTAHPVLVTDSGELNWWITSSAYGDGLGTTMYRTVFSQRTGRSFSYDYIFPAWLYRAKSRAVGWLRGREVIVIELQGEPWGAKPFVELTAAERVKSFSLERLLELRHFVERTGLPEAYWWGVEYWYWEKVVNGEPAFWEAARSFF